MGICSRRIEMYNIEDTLKNIETLNRMLEVSTELIQPFIVVGANLNGKVTIRIRNQVF